MCKRLLNNPDIEHDIGLGIVYFDDGYKVHHVIMMCLIFMVGLGIFLCCYRRHAKRQMKTIMDHQIESAVNHYVSLSQKDSSTREMAE